MEETHVGLLTTHRDFGPVRHAKSAAMALEEVGDELLDGLCVRHLLVLRGEDVPKGSWSGASLVSPSEAWYGSGSAATDMVLDGVRVDVVGGARTGARS